MSVFLAMVIKPFVGVVLFGLAYWIATLLLKFIPEGRVKRLLTRQVGYKSAEPRRYKDW